MARDGIPKSPHNKRSLKGATIQTIRTRSARRKSKQLAKLIRRELLT